MVPDCCCGDAPDWAGRYKAGETRWDLGGAHPELLRRIAAGELAPRNGRRAWVPGCGRGHDLVALASAGWCVTGLDIVEDLRGMVEPGCVASGGRFLLGDALLNAPPEPVELIFDHTFFCALPPTRRAEFGVWARSVLAPGGQLCSLVFPADRPRELGGPPFPMTTADLAEALGGSFALLLDEAVDEAGAGRAWRERWAIFERTE